MKTLYLSDLDGTLLRSDERVSEYTANIINRFVRDGGCFSYATARSIVTASKVTAGLNLRLPVICHNGAFIIENGTNKILLSNYFTKEETAVIQDTLAQYHVYPVVFAYIDGVEKFSYIKQCVTPAARYFLDKRIGDPRRREVSAIDELYFGDVHYIACTAYTDSEETLAQINDIFKTDDRFNCIYAKDIYSGYHSCELLSKSASKANAALQLKAALRCDKLVVFGDNLNDMSMFAAADESCAVANAVPELKEIATAVIDYNEIVKKSSSEN